MVNESKPAVALFDADETLVCMKSLFELLRYHLAQRGRDDYDQVVEPMRQFAAAGATARQVNAKYFELFAGVPLEEITEEGRQWFAKLSADGVPYVDATVRALRAHQEAGHPTVIVSGSWLPCLQPIADDLGIDRIFCTEPEVDASGVLTGGVRLAMFEEQKEIAARSAIAEYGAEGVDCFAYADDIGDLDLLRCVGNPTVIGGNAALLDVATAGGWPVLDNAPVAGTARIRT